MTKMQKPLRATVFGGGSWGTALAQVLADGGHEVRMYVRDASVADSINTEHKNSQYLKQYTLNKNIIASTKLSDFTEQDIYVLSIPSQNLRDFLRSVKDYLPKNCILINTAKGIERNSGNSMYEIVSEELADLEPRYAILSGPSFADEVMQNKPTAVVLASEHQALLEELREAFSTKYFRCYSCNDVLGVELGGALKNIMAIAVGLCDGLGFGQNSRAALLTRSLAEMSRLGLSLGAKAATFTGLSGLGDLCLTANGNLSRNRQVGLRLGQGESLAYIVDSLGMVAEGVKTTEAVHAMIEKHNINAPITTAVYNILYNNLAPRECALQLMQRDLREE